MNSVNIMISLKAAALANWLIVEFEVQHGYGLAKFLKQPPYFDNHTAVGLWVEYAIRTWPRNRRTTMQLKQAFIDSVPIRFHST